MTNESIHTNDMITIIKNMMKTDEEVSSPFNPFFLLLLIKNLTFFSLFFSLLFG